MPGIDCKIALNEKPMKSYRDFFVAVSINVFFLALCVLFGKIQFGALDDFFMAGILTGIHGDAYNPHMYFVNALYGYVLLPLYYLFPKIGWYYLGEMTGVFASFTLISYVLIKKLGISWGSCVAAVLLSLLCSDFYLVIQFTQCATLYTAVGFSALLYSLCEKKSNVLIFSCIMIIWGSWMRWEAFLMGIPFFCIATMFLAKNLKKTTSIGGITILVLFFLVLGMHSFDKGLYDTEEYLPYKEIQGPRAAFGDARNYNMQAVYEDMEEMGKSGLDYAMLTNWEFYDTENFCVDSLREILKYVDYHRNKFFITSIFSSLLGALHTSSGRPVLWLYVFFCMLLFLSNSRNNGYTWISLGCILCLLAYLLTLNRLVYRVETGIWLYASFFAIPLLKNKCMLPLKFAFATILFLIVANIVVYSQTGVLVRDPTSGVVGELGDVKDSTNYSLIFDYIEKNPDKMFLVGMNTYMKFARHKNPPYLSEPIGSFKRIVSFGYWTPYLPEITQSLRNFGITNPLKDVVKNNVVVIDVPNIGDYLQRHYYDSVTVEIVNKINDVTFYKYSVEDK